MCEEQELWVGTGTGFRSLLPLSSSVTVLHCSVASLSSGPPSRGVGIQGTLSRGPVARIK